MAYTEEETWLTPAEVAAIFRVDPKTVTRWAQAELIPEGSWIFTPGGHRRYKLSAMIVIRDHGTSRRKPKVVAEG